MSLEDRIAQVIHDLPCEVMLAIGKDRASCVLMIGSGLGRRSAAADAATPLEALEAAVQDAAKWGEP